MTVVWPPKMEAMAVVTPLPLLPLPPVMLPKTSMRVERKETRSGKLLVFFDHHVQVPGVAGAGGEGSEGV